MKNFDIELVATDIKSDLIHKINFKTKPLGSLGRLEDIALQIGSIQNTLTPELIKPHMVVFAADHGIALEGVSAYPQEVTYQMVLNFLNGGAAINVFCKQNSICIKVVDAGVNYDFPINMPIIGNKVGKGTRSFLKGAAMTLDEAWLCISKGAEVVNKIKKEGSNIIGFGEMGIGNTSSASALMNVMCGIPIEDCVGIGTGIDDGQYMKKIAIIRSAIELNGKPSSPIETLATYGGYEIAQMCGAMLQAAENKMIIMVDGFIATSAYLVAFHMNPEIKEYAIFCHQSGEKGHGALLRYLKASPLLQMNMRLGEGTGVAVAYPIIQAAVNFLNEMASFEDAGVSSKN